MPIESINPSTGEIIATYEEASSEDVAAILERADRAFRDWRRTDSDHRAGLMRRAGALLRDRTEEYAALMAREMGKPLAQGRSAPGCATTTRPRPRDSWLRRRSPPTHRGAS
jgi:acyl-CoA reductase-like NAD-dependent aldehyde dehydrogenase